ncbi:hypothetical protein BD410DRAFT_37967 [Rickenella mellea]|uniref:Uncharacterized protein n=1 Tax=Rickenella mellea TaxID=50990 RepID=A0A4R5XF03_9AGAM|nr:hypothetical protein BD410DRAFT_37967 [Rickenella mellea]
MNAHPSHALDFGQQHSVDPSRRGPSSTAPSTRRAFLEHGHKPAVTSSASRTNHRYSPEPPATEELRRMRQGKSMPHLPLEQESDERTRTSKCTNKALRRSTQYPPRPMLPQIASRGSLPPIPRQLASPCTPATTKRSPESSQAVRASQLSTPPTSPSLVMQATQASRSSSRTNSTTSIGHSAESSLTSFSSHHTDTSDDISDHPYTVKLSKPPNPSDSLPARIDLISNSPPPPRPPRRKIPSPLIVRSDTSRTPADVKAIRRATLAVPSLTPPQSPIPWAAPDYSPTVRRRERHPVVLNPWHTPPGTPNAKFSGSVAPASPFQIVDHPVQRQLLNSPTSKRMEGSGQSSHCMVPVPDLPFSLAAHKLPRSRPACKPVNGRTFSEGGDWSPYLHTAAGPRASETSRRGKLRTQSEGATGFF